MDGCVCLTNGPNVCAVHPRLPGWPPAEIWQPTGYDQSFVATVPGDGHWPSDGRG